MKQRIIFAFALIVAGLLPLLAQTTALVSYEGGYFVKNGNDWTEYRPADRAGKWSSYEQYKETDDFFYLKNKKCRIAIPKIKKNKIFVDREKNGKWEIVYNTLDIYWHCPEPNGLFYCYRDGGGVEYDGYFVRDNDKWFEYRPGQKRGVWAEFNQVNEEEDFFILQSTNDKISIPKDPKNNIYIVRGSNWSPCYRTTAIYDRSAKYDYNFYMKKSHLIKGNGKTREEGKSARISFNRKGNIQLAYNKKHYDLTYDNIRVTTYDGVKAVEITIGKKDKVWLLSSNKCIIMCKSILPQMYVIDGIDSKKLKEIISLIENEDFYN